MKNLTTDLPNDVKAKLLDLAKRLPEGSRGEFLLKVRDRLAIFALEHTHALVYGIAGFIIGAILDHVLTLHVPLVDVALDITGGKLALLGAVLGAFLGKLEDMEEKRRRTQIAEMVACIVGEELRHALTFKGAE